MSHETIYRSLFIQARGVLKKKLVAHLRSRKQMRRTVAVMPTKWVSDRRCDLDSQAAC